jgi:hypothetical protein
VLRCKEEPMKELAAIRNIKMSSFLKLKVKTRCCTCTCDGDRTQTEQLSKKRSTHEVWLTCYLNLKAKTP